MHTPKKLHPLMRQNFPPGSKPHDLSMTQIGLIVSAMRRVNREGRPADKLLAISVVNRLLRRDAKSDRKENDADRDRARDEAYRLHVGISQVKHTPDRQDGFSEGWEARWRFERGERRIEAE